MAKGTRPQGTSKNVFKRFGSAKRTSIGMGRGSRPKSKSAKRDYKAYRGQGRP